MFACHGQVTSLGLDDTKVLEGGDGLYYDLS